MKKIVPRPWSQMAHLSLMAVGRIVYPVTFQISHGEIRWEA
jgi:hypothetical protein